VRFLDLGLPTEHSTADPAICRQASPPISLDEYVELNLQSNPDVERDDLVQRLEYAVDAFKRGVRCHCGEPIWIIGSAEAGLSCFSCITGDAQLENDYEIDVSEQAASASRRKTACHSVAPSLTVTGVAVRKVSRPAFLAA
jgi:hypothetical protein